MNITKCDICRKAVKYREQISIGYLTFIPRYSLCLKCAKPIIDFLKKNKLIKDEK